MGPRLQDFWPFLPDWLPVKSYGLAIALGFLLGAWLAHRRARRIGLSGESVIDLSLWAIVAGVAGARLFYVVQYWGEKFSGEPLWRIFAFHQGGLVFYGGLLAALPVSVWFVKRRHLPVGATLDVLASVVMLGLAFGRIGCFSYGCCWGGPTDSACGIVFPPDAPAYAHPQVPVGSPLFPTQLLSFATAMALFVALSLHFRFWRRRDGETAALLLILYPANRFVLEFFRLDTHVPGGLSVSQWISLFTAIGGGAWLAILLRRPPAAAPSAPPPEAAPEDPASQAPEPRPTSRSKKRREKKRRAHQKDG